MNRLTKRIDENKYASNVRSELSAIDSFQKLGQLEDIEEELGIDLITLFKALDNGFIYKCYDNTLIESFTPAFKENCIYVDEELDEFVRPKDYGKTWALTEEEL